MSSIFFHIAFKIHLFVTFCGSKILATIKLDPEKWDDLRKGLDYNEAPVQQSDQINAPVAPLGLGIWAEMLKITGLIVLVILLIVLIVKLILKTKAPAKSTKKDRKIQNPNDKIPTALSSLELLWSHFQKAKEAGDYRECLRILYQISLKKLGENGWVKTKADKTNREYLNEIETGAIASDFANLTLIHEYSWYGDTAVKASEFDAYEPQFINFINNSGLEKK